MQNFLFIWQVVIAIPEGESTCENVITNNTLGSLYDKNASSLGVDICRDAIEIIKPSASTDMGNVSHVVPSIHPLYGIPTEDVNHTHPFTDAAGRLENSSWEPLFYIPAVHNWVNAEVRLILMLNHNQVQAESQTLHWEHSSCFSL